MMRRLGIGPSGRGLSRRGLWRLAAAALAAMVAGGHTPYGQWTVYRLRNLFLVAARTDPAAVALAEALAQGLARELPESQARMTRAADPVRVASLLATGQLDVAVVGRDEAALMREGGGAFAAVGPAPILALADLGGHLLVTVESFRPRHAYLLSEAVAHLRAALPKAVAAGGALPVPEHPGAAAWRAGAPLPEHEPEQPEQAKRGAPAR